MTEAIGTEWTVSGATTTAQYLIVDIHNEAGVPKIATWRVVTVEGLASPEITEGGGVWNNTSDLITSIQFQTIAAGATMNTGSTFKVYGSRN